jgi:hypothetical protein
MLQFDVIEIIVYTSQSINASIMNGKLIMKLIWGNIETNRGFVRLKNMRGNARLRTAYVKWSSLQFRKNRMSGLLEKT